MVPNRSELFTRRGFFGGLSAVVAGVMFSSRSAAHFTAPVMRWEEWVRYDALGIAELVRRSEVSALEVAEQTMHAVHLVNPALNAVIEFYYDKLMPGALDRLPAGVFHGVPFMFKDIVDVEKGRVAEAGSRSSLGRIVQEDPASIRRIRQSGLNFLGRTTAPEFGNSILTETLQNGTSYNPWGQKYSPGGSSGGAGAIVAAGAVPMAGANDAGGSTRLPASMCGNVGLKYSREIANAIGETRDPLSFWSVGVNTRTVRDQAAFLDAALHPDKTNASLAGDGTYLAALNKMKRGLKIAVSSTQWGPYEAPSDAIAEMHRVADALRDLGHIVEEADPKIRFQDLYKSYRIFWSAPQASRVPPEEANKLPPSRTGTSELLEAINRKMYEDGKRWSWDDYRWALATNREITGTIVEFLSTWDLFLTPTTGRHTSEVGSRTALWRSDISIDEWYFNIFEELPYTPLGNYCGIPGISVPVARFGSGMPLGMHFYAAHGADALLLQIAAQLEKAMPWFENHPPVHVTKLG